MEEKIAQIPFIAHESSMTRMERIIKRLVVALIISILLMFASNALWLYAWMQYDYSSDATTTTTTTTTTTEENVTVDGKDGTANYNYIGDGSSGEITNGTSEGQKSDNKNTDKNSHKKSANEGK